MDFFTAICYVVERIDGDYAFLRPDGGKELSQVARALLPVDIEEGTRLLWENLSYRILEDEA